MGTAVYLLKIKNLKNYWKCFGKILFHSSVLWHCR